MQYSQMEAEMSALKRRHFESRLKVRALREAMREQRAKSRQLIVSVALKLHEKEKQIDEVRPLSLREFRTGRIRWMSHRKWNETKQQPRMLPGPAVPGCCLISFHFLWAIHPIRPVLTLQGVQLDFSPEIEVPYMVYAV